MIWGRENSKNGREKNTMVLQFFEKDRGFNAKKNHTISHEKQKCVVGAQDLQSILKPFDPQFKSV